MLRWCLLFVAFVSFSGCNKQLNEPQDVVKFFLQALTSGSYASLDTLVAWDKALINDYYSPADYFNAQSAEKKQELIQSYKQKLFNEDLPLTRGAKYLVKTVYISRGDADANIQITFPQEWQIKGGKQVKLDFVLRMQFNPGDKRWYIYDFGDIVRLNILKGDFDPGHFYLPKPILP